MVGTISTPISRTPARVFRDPPHARLDIAASLWVRGHHPAARDVALILRVVEDPGEVDGMGGVEADDPGPDRAGPHSGICRRRKDEEKNQQWETYSNRFDFAYEPHEKVERETGIEPATSSLGSWHSTAELLPLIRHSSLIFGQPPRPGRR